jgi:hypothetical protein
MAIAPAKPATPEHYRVEADPLPAQSSWPLPEILILDVNL